MAEIKTILTILLIGALIWNLGMLAFAFTRQDKRRASYISLLATAIIFYTLGYLLEIQATTVGEIMMALRIENMGIPLVTPFFILTALGFFQPRLLRPWMTVASVIYGATMALLIFFNDAHMLYYSNIEMVYNGYFYASQLAKGPLYVFQQIISIGGMLLAYSVLAARYIRGSAKLRSQMNPFIVGSLIGFIANIAYFAGAIPMGLDPMPLALTTGLVFFVITLFKHKLMDLVPAAFDMAIENMDDVAIVLDSDWGFIYCNKKAKQLIPALASFSNMEEIMRADGWPVELGPESPEEISFEMMDLSTRKTTQQQASINTITDELGKEIGVSIIIRDVTDSVNMFQQLEALAITDHLTGAFNRRHFMTLVERQMAMAERHDLPVSILMLDIDHFKAVNDTFGHIAGDEVLCALVRIIGQQMRVHDVMARYGGEEFIILSTEKDELGLLAFANRLREAIEREIIIFEGVIIRITASFGAVMILPGQSFEMGLEAVDKALYEAKGNGRNQVVLGEMQEEEDVAISSSRLQSSQSVQSES